MTKVSKVGEVAVEYGQTVQAQVDVAGVGTLARARVTAHAWDEDGNLLASATGADVIQTATVPDPDEVQQLQLTRWASPSRTGGTTLTSGTVTGPVYASVTGADLSTALTGVTQIVTTLNGTPLPADNSTPFDLAGGSASSASPLPLVEGTNTVSVAVSRDVASGGDVTLPATLSLASLQTQNQLNAAGDAIVGTDWVSDANWLVTTDTRATGTSTAITLDASAAGIPPEVFQSERYTTGAEIRYRFAVGEGAVKVRVLMAEIFSGHQRAGRLVDIKARVDSGSDQMLEAGIDVWAEVGGYVGIVREYDLQAQSQVEVVVARNGASDDNPRLMGVEVLAAQPIIPEPEPSAALSMFTRDTWIDAWIDRWNNGVPASYPSGDKAMIEADAAAYSADRPGHVWAGPSTLGGVSSSGALTYDENVSHSQSYMRLSAAISSAAFKALVTQDGTLAGQVRDTVMAHVNTGDLNFNNRTRYSLTTGLGRADSHFTLAFGDWLEGIIVAYDLLVAYDAYYGTSVLTTSQRNNFATWCAGVAEWIFTWVDADLAQLFVNRAAGNYTLTSSGSSVPGFAQNNPLYEGGDGKGTADAVRAELKFNNRSCRFARAGAVAAVVADNGTQIDKGKKFFQDVVKFGYYPFGAFSDFHRAESGVLADVTEGWKYSAQYVGTMAAFAMALWNAKGDTSLFDYTTTAGTPRSSGNHWRTGGPKSLATMQEDTVRYVAQQWSPNRTYGGTAIHPGTVRVDELGGAHANVYYQSTYVQSTMKREGAPAYPANPVEGNFDPWRGDNGTFPAAAFMWFDVTADDPVVEPPPGGNAWDDWDVYVEVGDNLQTLTDANPAGSKFVLQSGTHRQQSVVPKAGNTYVGEPGCIVSGSKLLSGWTRDGTANRWYVGGQTHQVWAHGGSNIMQPGWEIQNEGEEVFVTKSGQTLRLMRVSSLSALSQTGPDYFGVTPEGRWFFDRTANRIWINVNPANYSRVETSTTPQAFAGDKVSGVTLDNLIVEKYASGAQTGAVGVGNNGSGWTAPHDWTVQYCTFRYNHGGGLAGGPGWTITNCKIHHNGWMGLSGDGVEKNGSYQAATTTRYVEIHDNLQLGYRYNWAGGAMKYVNQDGSLFEHNWIHDSRGNGIWFDIDNINCTIQSNLVERVGSNGIFYEISYESTIRWNRIRDLTGNINVHESHEALLYNSTSRGVTWYDNIASGGKVGFRVNHAPTRGSGDHGAYTSSGMVCDSNQVQFADYTGARHSSATPPSQTYTGNAWFHADGSFWYSDTSTAHNISGWNALAYVTGDTRGAAGTVPSAFTDPSAVPFEAGHYGPRS